MFHNDLPNFITGIPERFWLRTQGPILQHYFESFRAGKREEESTHSDAILM